MAISTPVTAGVNATATQYNDLRTDAITRYVRFVFQLDDAITVADEQGQQYLIPAGMTVTKIKHKLSAGTATIRIQKDTTDVDAGIDVTTAVANETTLTSPALTEDQILTLDVTAAAGATDLLVVVYATETI